MWEKRFEGLEMRRDVLSQAGDMDSGPKVAVASRGGLGQVTYS